MGGENKLSLVFIDGAPKLNSEVDDPASPTLGDELPNPKPTGFPMLPPGFPKANGLVLGGDALPKTLTCLSEEGRKMFVDVEEDVAVALPKRGVVTLELPLPSEGVGLNGVGLLDSAVLLLPNTELPNTDVGLDVVSEAPNTLVVLVAKKFGTLLEPRLGAVEVGRGDKLVDGVSVSWLDEPGTNLDVTLSMVEGAPNEKPEVGRLEVEVDVFEAATVKTDLGGSGVVTDVDGSLGLEARPKGSCVGAGLEGGTKGGNVKPPVFVVLSLIGGSLNDASADPAGGFGMVNNEGVFSGGVLEPKMGAELVAIGLQIVDNCEEPSNSD